MEENKRIEDMIKVSEEVEKKSNEEFKAKFEEMFQKDVNQLVESQAEELEKIMKKGVDPQRFCEVGGKNVSPNTNFSPISSLDWQDYTLTNKGFVTKVEKKNKATEFIPVEEDLSVYSEDVLTLEEAIEAVAKEEGLTVEEVKAHVHKFQRDLYKKYTKKKVDKVKAKSKKKQAKKSKKKNR
ncbi:hypothetical protein pW2_31 [Bacillus phage pW2]|uniref:Uncharacterized protein n=1 Tax=Bacillus phage pW2 TaxID=2500559 RepID=A0A3Q9R7C8_9CAUD|nr:hypothetical protein PQE69_gp017 [Bacillus phage pW2]AZU98870.1 hypothetical protein pW2_31 [Bacillus phage pW2]